MMAVNSGQAKRDAALEAVNAPHPADSEAAAPAPEVPAEEPAKSAVRTQAKAEPAVVPPRRDTDAETERFDPTAPLPRTFGLARTMRGPALAGLITVGLFFGGLGTWAATAPLAGAAIEQGTISPASDKKTIQHLEGGIVHQIFVKEGSQVAVGDVLMTILDIKARSTFEQDALKHYQLNAERIRLEAELAYLAPAGVAGSNATAPAARAAAAIVATADAATAGVTVAPVADPKAQPAMPPLTFPADVQAVAEQRADSATLLEGERRQFEARWMAYTSNVQMLQQAIAKSEADILALGAQTQTIVAQSVFMDQEIVAIQALVDQKLETGSSLLDLKRQRLQQDEDKASLAVRIAADQESVRYSEIQIENLRATQIQDVTNTLATVHSDLATTQQRMDAEQDALTRTVVRSPVDGTVTDMQVHTIGGVVGAGETLMSVVPRNDSLVIDAHINPNDMDSVRVGQSVEVVLNAYPSRRMPVILGTMTTVSADAITDSTGSTYFLGKVEVDPKEIASFNRDIKFMPGMTVELKVMTEERTFLDYILEPWERAYNRSFVES